MDEEEFAFLLVTYPNLKSIISQKKKKKVKWRVGNKTSHPIVIRKA